VLSVQIWYQRAFVVVTMAMLGSAAADTLVMLRPSLREGDVGAKLAWSSLLFGVAVTVGHVLLKRTRVVQALERVRIPGYSASSCAR